MEYYEIPASAELERVKALEERSRELLKRFECSEINFKERIKELRENPTPENLALLDEIRKNIEVELNALKGSK